MFSEGLLGVMVNAGPWKVAEGCAVSTLHLYQKPGAKGRRAWKALLGEDSSRAAYEHPDCRGKKMAKEIEIVGISYLRRGFVGWEKEIDLKVTKKTHRAEKLV